MLWLNRLPLAAREIIARIRGRLLAAELSYAFDGWAYRVRNRKQERVKAEGTGQELMMLLLPGVCPGPDSASARSHRSAVARLVAPGVLPRVGGCGARCKKGTVLETEVAAPQGKAVVRAARVPSSGGRPSRLRTAHHAGGEETHERTHRHCRAAAAATATTTRHCHDKKQLLGTSFSAICC